MDRRRARGESRPDSWGVSPPKNWATAVLPACRALAAAMRAPREPERPPEMHGRGSRLGGVHHYLVPEDQDEHRVQKHPREMLSRGIPPHASPERARSGAHCTRGGAMSPPLETRQRVTYRSPERERELLREAKAPKRTHWATEHDCSVWRTCSPLVEVWQPSTRLTPESAGPRHVSTCPETSWEGSM